MEVESSFPCSQERATDPYLQTEELSPQLQPCFPNIHSNIILPSTPRSSDWSLPFRISDQDFVCISHVTMHATSPSITSSLVWSPYNNIWWSVQVNL